MSWGHAVSRDMLHWQHLPVALSEEDGVMIFSGMLSLTGATRAACAVPTPATTPA